MYGAPLLPDGNVGQESIKSFEVGADTNCMMISGDQTDNVIAAASTRVEGATPRMSLSVSDEILEQATRIASQSPDIRADRVEVAMRRMHDGSVSAEEIATMMVRRIVAESLI